MLDDRLQTLLASLWASRVQDNPAVEARARELLLDTIGCAIAGAVEPDVIALYAETSRADPGLIGFPAVSAKLTTVGFATCFAAAACWHEACEGLAAAHGRPGLHAIAAALGPALLRQEPLGALLDAIAAGYEVGGRLGMVLRIRPGMHVDGVWGSFAAVAAVCRLAKDSPAATLASLNHAACHLPFSLYRPVALGSTARNAFAGHGAVHGAASAVASRAGLGGPPGSITEWARLALGLDPANLTAFPGPDHCLLLDGYLKRYPAVRHVHYGAAAAEAWARKAAPDTITAVTLRIYDEAMTYCGNRGPTTAIQAQFSLSYGVARCLVHGTLDPTAYSSTALSDEQTRRVEALIVLEADPVLTESGRRGCTLDVTAGGCTWQHAISAVPGDPAMPMTRGAVTEKFMAYATPVIGVTHGASLADRVLTGALNLPFSLAT